MNETISPPSLFFKRFHGRKRQTIVDLISDSTTGLTRSEVAAAIDSPTNCVSVMINQINKELANQGWKINSTDLERQPGRRGAPGRRYRLVRLSFAMSCQYCGRFSSPGNFARAASPMPSRVRPAV
jgi:hypothetical protein